MRGSISYLNGFTLNIYARFPISRNEFAKEEIGSLLIVMMEQLYHELLIAFLRRLSHLTEGINTSHCVFSYKQ